MAEQDSSKRIDPRDLDNVAGGWEFNPTDETVNVRLVNGPDGVEKVQLRVRFGVLQLFADGAPETGGGTIREELARDLAAWRAHKGSDKGFSISALRTAQASQEIMDFYQRRVCFFLLADYRRAMRDAEHNLDLMRLLKKYSVDERTVLNHDRYRAFVMMDRTRASAMIAFEAGDYDHAVAEVDETIEAIRAFYKEYGREDLIDKSSEIEVLENLKSDLRKEHHIPLSASERLMQLREEQARAIVREDYEKAARLRDEIQEIERPGRL
jgi:hypothetical protein